MVEETPKIFEGPFRVAVTCVRVPVLRAHCESINLQFKRPTAPIRNLSATLNPTLTLNSNLSSNLNLNH